MKYRLKIKRYTKGKYGLSPYKFDNLAIATIFAAGYQAALRDVNRTDLYVVVDSEVAREATSARLRTLAKEFQA